jgi:CRISPR/Cas system-associated endonuclease Cas1
MHEAHSMKEYWECYDSALKPALQWFGPRKRYRFVREYVDNPGGSAKGYSALHAAINYLHQRRLRQALRINEEVGFEGTADGFLHHERYSSRHIGLLFDMIDPFKFADREELLAVVLNRGITWKDFRMESDRRNSTFYCPGSSAINVLDRIGVDADQIVVRYQGIESSLIEAYRRYASSLLRALASRGEREFEPFVYAPV